jgi:heat shock protein HslJ
MSFLIVLITGPSFYVTNSTFHIYTHTNYTHLSHQFTYRNKQRNKTTETNQQQQRRANSWRVLEFTTSPPTHDPVKRITFRITGACKASGNQTSIKKGRK